MVTFWETREPGFSRVRASGADLSRDRNDPSITRLTFWTDQGPEVTVTGNDESFEAQTHPTDLEIILTRGGVRNVAEELDLLLDAYVPSAVKSELAELDLTKEAAAANLTGVIEYAKGFRRIYSAGCTSKPSKREVRIAFWSRKVRVEADNEVKLTFFVEAEAAMLWRSVKVLADRVHHYLQAEVQ